MGGWIGTTTTWNKNLTHFNSLKHYDSTNKSTDYLIHVALKRDRNYDEGLTMMAERLQPFIDAFFKWVETI